MPVGLSVAEYEKKKSPYEANFAKAKPVTSISAYNPNKTLGLSSMSATPENNLSSTQQPGTASGMSALGNSSGQSFGASALLKSIPEPTFQPYYSGNSRANMFGQGRLQAIDQIGELANEEIQQKILVRNAQIKRRNAEMQQSSVMGGSNPNPFFSGGGGISGLDDEQATNARIIASVGRQRGMDDNAIQIAIMTALTESSLRNVAYGDAAGPDSRGLFQQRPSQGWGTFAQVQDPTYAANKFYDTLARTNYKALSPWAAAQAVQRSAYSDGSNYAKNWSLAQRAFGSLNQPQSTMMPQSVGGNSDVANFITQNNNKYIDWDGAYGAQCVDLYNKYTATFVGGKNYMVGWAPEIFNNYDANAYRRVGNNVPGGMGYVAVFNRGGATPFGHVAIVVGDNGNGTLRVLHSNATPAGSRGNSVISNISKASLMGYLIPNKLMGR